MPPHPLESTPYLAVDVDVLERNIDRMADFATTSGISLRPHVKTHKSVEIARRQLDAGATGITVATLSEAEVFAQAGFDDIFIAYPVWLDPLRANRLRRAMERARVSIGADSLPGLEKIAAAGLGPNLSVLIEVDSGHHRSGALPSRAGEIAAAGAALGLDVAGVFTFPGHSYSSEGREQAAMDEAQALAQARDTCLREGISPRVVSGGSTPSVAFADGSVLTEVRPGVYVFNDAQQWELGTCQPENIALTAYATVVSRNETHAILDAGSKVLASDRPEFCTGYGRLLDYPEARIVALSEHHATVTGVELAVGTNVRVVPNHVCVAVNLADRYLLMRGVAPIGEGRVDARGANS
ncbi:MAG TPA: alanine racemase [Acidothermaceae bacterium]|nr:alanine racemase [Acidothermaceae bacterium]